MKNEKGRLIINSREQEFIEKEIMEIDNNGLWKYNYVAFNKNNQYNFENFCKEDGSFQNKNILSNYEKQSFNSVRLVLAKTFVQAFGSLEMALLLAEYSRLSLKFPINKYGFFRASYKTIQTDTGISEFLQRKHSKKLEELGYITTITFRKEKTKFYKFNDNYTRQKLIEYIKKLFKQTPTIKKQI
jgi:hypothetical protein